MCTARTKGQRVMNGLARHCWRLKVIALVVGICLPCFLSLPGSLRDVPGDPLAAPGRGVAFAAGAGSGPRGTVQSTFQSECASCHGANGKGGGWTAWLFRLKMRDLTDAAYMRTVSDDYLFQIIKQGGDMLGKPGMPSWGQKLTDREIRDLVAYVRSLSPPRPPMPPTKGPR